jgi:hypothetical protein
LAPVDRQRSKKGSGSRSETLSELLKPGGRYWVRTSDLFGVNAVPAHQPLSSSADQSRLLRPTYQAASLNDNACQRFC